MSYGLLFSFRTLALELFSCFFFFFNLGKADYETFIPLKLKHWHTNVYWHKCKISEWNLKWPYTIIFLF